MITQENNWDLIKNISVVPKNRSPLRSPLAMRSWPPNYFVAPRQNAHIWCTKKLLSLFFNKDNPYELGTKFYNPKRLKLNSTEHHNDPQADKAWQRHKMGAWNDWLTAYGMIDGAGKWPGNSCVVKHKYHKLPGKVFIDFRSPHKIVAPTENPLRQMLRGLRKCFFLRNAQFLRRAFAPLWQKNVTKK